MMRIKFMIISAIALVASITSSQAIACKFVQSANETERAAAAKATVASAAAIIDAKVVRSAGQNGKPALLKAIRVIKGPKGKKFYAVTGATSCDQQFTKTGSRQRVLLFGGPKTYRASMYASTSADIDRAIAALGK
jgi:hypothetical protein